MIRSSTSVRFITWVTLLANRRSSQRRRTSSKMKVRKLPMWTRFQTVGPHVYRRTWPGSIGSTATSSRLIVSCSWRVTAVPAAPSPRRRSLRSGRRSPYRQWSSRRRRSSRARDPAPWPSRWTLCRDPQRAADGPEIGSEPRLLGDGDDVGAADRPAFLAELLGDDLQKLAARGVLPARVAGREVPAHVAEPGRSEDGVDERMHHGVAVRMTEQTPPVRNQDAAEHQRPPGDEPVRVDAMTD